MKATNNKYIGTYLEVFLKISNELFEIYSSHKL